MRSANLTQNCIRKVKRVRDAFPDALFCEAKDLLDVLAKGLNDRTRKGE